MHLVASRRAAACCSFVLLSVCIFNVSATVLDLTSHGWTLQNANGSIQLATQLPSYALAELHKAGVVADPLFRYGELSSRWVALEAWKWTTMWQLQPGDPLLTAEQVLLALDGVDTVADVVLNGQQLATLDNYHRAWHLPVSGQLLQPGANTLSLVVHPAAMEAQQRKQSSSYPIPTMQAPGMLDAYNFLRKPASDFGWDWGPAFAAAGIHGRVRLMTWDTARLAGVHVHQQHEEDVIQLQVTALLLVPPRQCLGTVQLSLPELDVLEQQQVAVPAPPDSLPGQAPQLLEHNATFQLCLPASQVQLWWPVGLGDQKLYQLTITWQPEGVGCSEAPSATQQHQDTQQHKRTQQHQGRSLQHCPCEHITRQIGFRKVELVRQPMLNATGADTPGESFFFQVNGVAVFAKGANVIPLHIMAPSVTQQRLRGTLEAARAANMNMLRIWGGGIYQSEEFYNWCDENGLMVWQETMFACSPYPRDLDFLGSVRAEVRQQVMRLSSHPSVVIWGGNNEIETSLEWYEESRSNPHLFAVDYAALFLDVIQQEVQQLLPGFPFVDSSPSNGHFPQQAQVKRWGNAQDPGYGDVHFYDYTKDCQDWRTYPQARFVSEYGWQSYPSWATYSSATYAEDWGLRANMTEFRQRHPQGTAELLSQLRRHFKLPDSWSQQPPTSSTDQPLATPGNQESRHASHYQQTHQQQQEKGHVQHEEVKHGQPSGDALASQLVRHLLGALQHQAPTPSQQGSPLSFLAQGDQSGTGRVLAARAGDEWGMQAWLYLGQVQQLLCYSTALGLWRRLRGDPLVHTMGVLYWQLNDVWAGASWSSLDWGLQWKPLHYEVKRLYAPLAVTVHEEGGQLQIHLINDHLEQQQVQLLVHLHSLNDNSTSCHPPTAAFNGSTSSAGPLHAQAQEVVLVPANTAALVWQGGIAELLAQRPGCSSATCYVHIRVLPSAQPSAQQHNSNNGHGQAADGSRQQAAAPAVADEAVSAIAEATYFLAPFHEMQLPDPQLQATPLQPEDTRRRQHTHIHRTSGSSSSSTPNSATRSSSSATTTTSSSTSGSTQASTGSPVSNSWSFTVSSTRPALSTTWALPPDLPGLLDSASWFSDNAVVVHPCYPREVTLHVTPGGTLAAELAQRQEVQLQLTSLFDYQFDAVAVAARPGAAVLES